MSWGNSKQIHFFIFCSIWFLYSQAWAEFQPSAEFVNKVIHQLRSQHAPGLFPGQIQGVLSNIIEKKLPTWKWDEEEVKLIKVLDNIPKGFSSYNDALAVSSSVFSDYNFYTSKCIVVIVKDNYKLFKKRIIEPLALAGLENLSDEEVFSSVLAHEFAHCLEKIQISKAISEQNKERFFYLLPFSNHFGFYPRGIKSVEQNQWIEGLADIFQVFYLTQLIGDLNMVVETIIKVRSEYKDQDPGHDTSIILNKIKNHVTIDQLQTQSWIELALNLRSLSGLYYYRSEKN